MNRIKELRNQRKISQLKLAKELNVHQTAVSQWEQNRTSPDSQLLPDIAAYFGVSVDYLLGIDDDKKPVKKSIKAPVLGYVAAGIPIEAIEDIVDYEELDAGQFNPNYEYFGLKIQGDSMMPRMHDGDVVIVQKQSDVESGDVAIVCINGDKATCKQIKKHTNGITLIPYNTAYEPMFFTEQEVHDKPITVLGKVVELRGKF